MGCGKDLAEGEKVLVIKSIAESAYGHHRHFFSKICRDETIRMIYVLPEMDKNLQRYLASNTPKIGFFNSGRKEAGSN